MDYSIESLRSHAIKNIDFLLQSSTICALIAEHKSAIDDSHNFVNETGYDQVCPITGIKTEVKYTNYSDHLRRLKVANLATKKGICDFIKIIDGRSNRTFLIPSDVFFNEGKFHFKGSVFRWLAEYKTKSTRKNTTLLNNTKLLLRYEVNSHA